MTPEGWPGDLDKVEQTVFKALEAFGGEDDGVACGWTPEPGVVSFTTANGHQMGNGPRFVSDRKGGGVLQRKSRITKRWLDYATVTPYIE